MTTHKTGVFGKLPAHGDFLQRNLPSKVVNTWDSWLQTFVGSSQERLGEQWLEIYLTSPIWRFCWSPGVMDDHYWAGIMLPSVDRVGRYFPFSIISQLPAETFPCSFMTEQEQWFEQIEAVAIKALQGQMQVDGLLEEIAEIAPSPLANKYLRQSAPKLDSGLIVDTDFNHPSAADAMPHLLEGFVAASYNSYGVWSTNGSEKVEPCVFICPAMPAVAGAPAMLDGLWEDWGWSVPVRPLELQHDVEQHPEPHEPSTADEVIGADVIDDSLLDLNSQVGADFKHGLDPLGDEPTLVPNEPIPDDFND